MKITRDQLLIKIVGGNYGH